MAIEDRIMQDLTPGMQLSIKGAANRYRVAYSTAQKGLRRLWKSEFVNRKRQAGNHNELQYEGKQERLM